MIYRALKRNKFASIYKKDAVPPPDAFMRESDNTGTMEEELSFYCCDNNEVKLCDAIGGPSQLREIFGLVNTNIEELMKLIDLIEKDQNVQESF